MVLQLYSWRFRLTVPERNGRGVKVEECPHREPILISWVTALGSALQRAKMGGLMGKDRLAV